MEEVLIYALALVGLICFGAFMRWVHRNELKRWKKEQKEKLHLLKKFRGKDAVSAYIAEILVSGKVPKHPWGTDMPLQFFIDVVKEFEENP